jgi:hypothetical protein
MNTNLMDNWLIDVGEPDMRQLLATDQSALANAIGKILATEKDDVYSSFNASI